MLLGSDSKSILLINAVESGNCLVVGLFYAEPTEEPSAIVNTPDKTLVYKVFLPAELAKSCNPVTAINIKIPFERL